MRARTIFTLSFGTLLCALAAELVPRLIAAQQAGPSAARPGSFDETVERTSTELFRNGRQIFRFDTFGDEQFWSGTLKLHQAIAGARLGGVGPGVGPAAALAAGLKVDVEMVPHAVLDGIKSGAVNLNDPANTLALINAKAVVGVMPFPSTNGAPASIGFTCALCHSDVDNSFAPGIGLRLDGWANRDLNVGAIIAMSPDLSAVANLLQTDVAAVRNVMTSWGPGKFDAQLFLDGKGFRPDGKTAATLIPPAYGLAGVNLHTSTGWGGVPYWNAFVANLEMHGSGTFYDPRLNDKAKYPVAARAGFGNAKPANGSTDGVTSRLAALQYYQLSIPAPAAPAGSFNQRSAEMGEQLFRGRAGCASCHVPPIFTEPGGRCTLPRESASTTSSRAAPPTTAIAPRRSKACGRASGAAFTMMAVSQRFWRSSSTTTGSLTCG